MALTFGLGLASILAQFLEKQKNKTAAEAGEYIDDVDQATLAILQENARIKGAAVDWNDPTAVQAFLATLPAPTPIPDPAAQPPIVQSKDLTKP